MNSCNIVIGGEAGQGLVTVGRLLTKIAVRTGYRVVVTQSYQSRIRGGHNTFAVRIARGEIDAPAEKIDLLVALSAETVALHRSGLSSGGQAAGGLVIADEAYDVDCEGCVKVPFGKLAEARFMNTAALGVICSVLGLERDMSRDVVLETFGAKHREVSGENRKAFEDGYAWGEKHASFGGKLTGGEADTHRLMLDGNQAIALGAASAGVKLCSFYPMTPATSVPLTLIGMAEQMGIVVEQAEDEIAAINMAIGASYAGAPAMVATSGGGFALMVEGVSLAAMTETPLVVVVAQRPGPATGLPTRTEQADLEFVLHSGHGEFPRAIFAPGTVEDCFHLTRKAFELAERYQGPVFVLTDQFLADSLRAVEPFDVEHLAPVVPGADPAGVRTPYLRHAITGDGVSPRLLPGFGRELVVTDSDEHTEDGHLTEDLEVRRHMVNKRLRKGDGIASEAVRPEYDGGEEPALLLVSWGSTRGSVREAAARLRGDGARVATLHFTQVWPLVPGHFVRLLEVAGRVVAVEGNATGQLARLIRRETGFGITELVGRYDGLPITPEYILRELEAG